jgi:hypothetical protein
VRNDLHPTMKPVALVERAIRNSSKTRDVVLDPFGGAGSTVIACEKAGRQARLVELDPGYCDVIVRRWEHWTGDCAHRAGSGDPFRRSSQPTCADPRPGGAGSAGPAIGDLELPRDVIGSTMSTTRTTCV